MTKDTQRDRMWVAALETIEEKRDASHWRQSFGAVDVQDKMDDPASARSLRDLLQTMADYDVIERASAQGKYRPAERESSSTKDQKDASGPSTSNAIGGVTRDSLVTTSDEDVQEDGDVDVDDLDLPGGGSTLEARRDAVRACYEYLRENGTATKAEFIQDVYDDHPARFGSSGGWWNAIGKKGLRELAREREDVDAPPEGGHRWQYVA